jgi:colanic acid/amylovoran biosynthesis glycosyltransferase
MRIAVIASLRRGLDHFVYRELDVFSSLGATIKIFPTKFKEGLHNPEPEWTVHHWHPIVALLLQPYFLLAHPFRYVRLLMEATRYRAWMDFAIAWHFANNMRDVDIIYSIVGDHKLFIGFFCKRIINKPLVVTIHAYELYRNPNPRLFVKALESCDQIITVTDYNKELLSDRYGIDPAAIRVVRCSVDVDAYKPSDKFVVLMVAYFEAKKGHETLLKAIRELDMDDIELWIVGSNRGLPSDVDVHRMAEELGITHRIAFFGELGGNALKAVYRNCDVFCLPSRFDKNGVGEGFPAVLMEAMAFGKPVITTRHVEIPRIIKEVLIEEDDVDGLANAIRRLRASDLLRQELGQQNRDTASRLFSTRNAQVMAAILEGLIPSEG